MSDHFEGLKDIDFAGTLLIERYIMGRPTYGRIIAAAMNGNTLEVVWNQSGNLVTTTLDPRAWVGGFIEPGGALLLRTGEDSDIPNCPPRGAVYYGIVP